MCDVCDREALGLNQGSATEHCRAAAAGGGGGGGYIVVVMGNERESGVAVMPRHARSSSHHSHTYKQTKGNDRVGGGVN